MSHQPFDNWIFDKIDLTIEQERALQDHLDTCPQCSQIHQNWKNVRLKLHRLPVSKPAQGFTQRWNVSLQARKELQQRSQLWRFFLFLISGIAGCIFILANQMVASTSIADWFVSLMEGAVQFIVQTGRILAIFITIASVIPVEISIGLWIILFSSFTFLVLFWIFTVWNIAKKGVYNR